MKCTFKIPAPRVFPVFWALLFCSAAVFAQDYRAEFMNHWPADTANQRKVLESWQEADPNNPELFTTYFNYYINKREVPKGLEKIEQGITSFPDRLDMRLGKMHVLAMIGDWEGLTAEITRAIQYSHVNKNNWTRTNNAKQNGGEDFFLSAIQKQQKKIFDTGDNELLANIRKIAEEVLNYYPENVQSLSTLAVTYLVEGDNDQAIELLKKAEKLSPQDCLVLSNLAEGYRRKGDKQEAVQYYEKILEFGTAEDKDFASRQIEALQ